MPRLSFDTTPFEAMGSATRAALAATTRAQQLRENLRITRPPEDHLFRHQIILDDNYYQGGDTYPDEPSTPITGLVVFTKKLLVPQSLPRQRVDVLLDPLVPDPTDPYRTLSEQLSSRGRVYLGISTLAIQGQIETVPIPEAFQEVRDNPEVIFNPLTSMAAAS